MTEIRSKDWLFLAVVVPIAVVTAYVWLWRLDAVRENETLKARDRALVAVDDFPSERRRLETRLQAAERELAAERAKPRPETVVKGDAKEGAAARERAVVDVFREAGLVVLKAETVANEPKAGPDAAAVLKATGIRPLPRQRVYRLEGGYPAVRQALKTIVAREMAVVVDRVARDADGKWEVSVHE